MYSNVLISSLVVTFFIYGELGFPCSVFQFFAFDIESFVCKGFFFIWNSIYK
jgi:hypothetical protein